MFVENLEGRSAEEKQKYIDGLALQLSGSEVGEWLAWELNHLYTSYLHALTSCGKEEIDELRGRIAMVCDLLNRFHVASHFAEARRAEGMDRGPRRWTPQILEDPGLL